MKKIVCFTFAFIYCFSLSAQGFQTSALDTLIIDNVRYEIRQDIFMGEKSQYAIVLPLEDFDKQSRKTYRGRIEIKSQITSKGAVYDVLHIGQNAFRGCTDLDEVILPESVVGIKHYAFAECGHLKLNQISSIGFIQSYAFKDTETSANFKFGNLKDLDAYSLAGWNIKEVVFEKGALWLGTYAFSKSNIERIRFDLVPPEDEMQIAAHALNRFNLKELKLPRKEKLTLASEFCYECPELERVVFPDMNNISYADDYQTITDIEGRFTKSSNLIAKCPKMKEIVVLNPTPPFFYRWIITNVVTPPIIDDHSQCVLKVPQGSEELYRADPVWGRFERIEGFAPGEYTGISEAPVTEVESGAVPVYYNLQGIQVKEPVKGQLYIRRTGAKTAKIVY